jgi:hypothetical protein
MYLTHARTTYTLEYVEVHVRLYVIGIVTVGGCGGSDKLPGFFPFRTTGSMKLRSRGATYHVCSLNLPEKLWRVN